MKTYSSNPYHDDYDQADQYYRILFRPGRAVQARELTQMQTLLQGQIERFGKNIFKEGSVVIPGSQTYDTKYNYVKLAAAYNSIDADDVIENLVGSIIVGRTTGVRAKVIDSVASTSTDEPTLYVKYLSQGTDGLSSVFADNEIIDNEIETIAVQAISSSATGTGTAFSIGSGAVFVKGTFAYFGEQTAIISKYSQPTNLIIGFEVAESLVTSDDDAGLLDPAIDSFNYFAPGADRYKIGLTIGVRNFTVSVADDPNFIEIIRIQDGEIVKQVYSSDYNILADTLARRTYDESGDYVVRPYKLKLKEHLRTTDANSIVSFQDGFYTAANGGNADLFINVITPGKAYVKGYEIDSIRNKYLETTKARDYVAINNGTVATQFGNYVFATNLNSIPSELANLPTVSFYNQYNLTPATANGTLVGTARIRHIEYHSGTVGSSTAVYKVFLFNIVMNTGYTFANDVKQMFINNTVIEDFTADIYPELTALTGTVTTNTTSNTIVGVGTLFNTDIAAGNYISINNQKLRILDIANNLSANVSPRPSANVTGYNYSLNTASVRDADKNVYVFPLPYSTIKSVDSTNTETIYSTRRIYSRTLSGGSVSITAGTDEVFSGFSSDNYSLVITSGVNAGTYIDLTGKVTRSGVPTGKTITFNVAGGYTNEDVIIITTIQKTISAADRKLKTLVEGSTRTLTSAADCQQTTISLAKADIFRLANVKMSANAFGTAYSESNAIDITDRFTLDNGQKATFYDVGRINLKPGQPKPTGPVKITFDYFTHGAGDYFSVNSYNDIDYADIGTLTVGDATYQLRDCLDFRSRIDDTGSNFTSSGASVTEFPDFENDIITDYEYYLPRTDKIVLDKNGKIQVINGISSANPQEPRTPEDSMALYILKQNPYVFDITKDIEIVSVDNKRYTMRDIGRIENRVKTLEYYTSLSLAEKDTQLFQIKDALGFDRFKNGFVVDSFTGHGIGDVYNSDYATAVDYNKNEARPLCETRFVNITELGATTAARTANNYVKVGDIITLPFTEVAFISNVKSSKSANLNPYNMVTFTGHITLDPPADVWFNDIRLPDVYRNVEGNYDSVVADAQAKGTYGTIWGSWRDLHYGNNGNEIIQQREGINYTVVETIDTTTNNDVVVSKSIIPKMRDAVIKFTAEGLKPNTRLYAYFNNISVDNYVKSTLTSNVSYSNMLLDEALDPIVTDSAGNAEGVFTYSASVFDLNTGTYKFRLLDVSGNDIANADVISETVFSSEGTLRNIENEIISTRNAILDSSIVTDTQSVYVYGGGGDDEWTPDYEEPVTPKDSLIRIIYNYAFGREPDEEGYEYWTGIAAEKGITASTLQNAFTSTENIQSNGGIAAVSFPPPAGSVQGDGVIAPASYNADAVAIFDFTKTIVTAGVPLGEHIHEGSGVDNAIKQYEAAGYTDLQAVSAAIGVQVATAIANPDFDNPMWAERVSAVVTNGTVS